MPRKKKILDDEEVEVSQKVEQLDPLDAKVKRILSAMPGGLKCISVFRYPEGNKGGRPSYIDDISPDQFSFQNIKQMFGGGRFQLAWDNENGTISQSDLIIDAPRLKLAHESDEDELKKKSDSEENPELEALRAYYKENEAGKHYRPSENPNGGISPIELIKLMHEAEEKAENRIMKMLELMKPAQQSPDMTKQVFDIVEKVAGMSSQFGGGGDGGSPLITALAMFKDPLTKIVDTIQTAMNRPPMPNPPVPPAGRPAQVPAVQAPQPQPKEEDVVMLMLRSYLPILVNAAAKNTDPSTYADLILDQIPESQYPSLSRWINQPDCLESLCQIEPGIRYQQDWWISLRQSIIEALNDAVQSPSTSEQSQQD